MGAWLDSWNATASAVTLGDSCFKLSSALNTAVIDRYSIIFNDHFAHLFSILCSINILCSITVKVFFLKLSAFILQCVTDYRCVNTISVVL